MITILDYITTHKAKAAAEGALILLGVSGAVWLIATKGLSNVTTTTAQESRNSIVLELSPDVSFGGAEGAGTLDLSVGEELSENKKEKRDVAASSEEINKDRNSSGIVLVDQNNGKISRGFGYKPKTEDLVPVQDDYYKNWLASYKRSKPGVHLPDDETIGKMQCQILVGEMGFRKVIEDKYCQWKDGIDFTFPEGEDYEYEYKGWSPSFE